MALLGELRRGRLEALASSAGAIGACERSQERGDPAGRWRCVLGLLEERRASGLASSGYDCGTVLRALRGAGRWQPSLLELERARAAWLGGGPAEA